MFMTKAQIIEKLHAHGEVWADASYPKSYLEEYLDRYQMASEMSAADLYAKIMAKKS